LTTSIPSSVEEHLRAVPLFADASDIDLAYVAVVARPQAFRKGTVICAEGVSGVGLHVITDGQVRVTSSHSPEVLLSAGSYFGEMAVLDGGPRMATVVAATDVSTLVIMAWEFARILEEQPAVMQHLVQALCARLREQAAHVTHY
jgi:CRP-like cAMP-binding protein